MKLTDLESDRECHGMKRMDVKEISLYRMIKDFIKNVWMSTCLGQAARR